MMRVLLTSAALSVAASPVLAAKGPFLSLANTDFVVLISFLIFIGVLVYFKVPGMIGNMLTARAEGIQGELNEAKALRDEAQSLLADYERKQKEVQGHAERIVAQAKADAESAAEAAKAELEQAVARRLAAAEEQITSAEASAVKEVRDEAAQVAIAAAREVIAKQMTAASANALIDDAISAVDAKLH